MSDTLYTSCGEVLSLCQSMSDDLFSILDPQTGFAPRLRQCCIDHIAELEESPGERVPQETLDALRLEQNTWGLLQALLPARRTDPPPVPTPRALLSQNPYVPMSTLAQSIMHASPLLTELMLVREWLQDTAPHPLHPEATTGYYKFTKHSIMQSLRTGSGQRDGLVKELDPDAANRDDGRSLASDDANYEKSLSQTLYTYIRAGKLEEAVELCRGAHQPWRAASIRGSLLFKFKAIANEPHDDSLMEDGDEDEGWVGNRRRTLWKKTCTQAALDPALSDPERILYASLSPSPETSPILRSACRTWEDHLWVRICGMCEEKETSEMRKLGGGFWEGGVDAVERAMMSDEMVEFREEEEWEKEVRDALVELGGVQVDDGIPADHPFHVSQLHIVLDTTSALLDGFAAGLKDHEYDPMASDYPIMTRFFAHLCLFLQMIDLPVPPEATQTILEAYLQVLQAAGQRDLIALYAGALGENAIERYAMFLTSLELTADIKERGLALMRARDHGLDTSRVAVATAESTIDKSFEMLPPLRGPLPSIITLQTPPSPSELLLLRSIEWTIFDPSTYETALEQANVIFRYFLGAGRFQVAKLLIAMLPVELAGILDPEERATEYLHYQQFFNIWETLDRVLEWQSLEVPGMSIDDKRAWVNDYQTLIEQAREEIVKLLTSEWLVVDVEGFAGGRRQQELTRIRQIYIPELIIRLHAILFNSRHQIPENLKLSLELANIVADSRYKLYEDFVDDGNGRRLGDYLGAVRQAILGGLEGGGSDPFRVMTL